MIGQMGMLGKKSTKGGSQLENQIEHQSWAGNDADSGRSLGAETLAPLNGGQLEITFWVD